MSNLSPMQFGAFIPADQGRSDTYPTWGEGDNSTVVHGRPAHPGQARQRLAKAKIMAVLPQRP